MSRYLYISDVYCPWCYAFGRILDELLAEHPLPVRVLAGELVEEPQTIDDMVREMPSITAFFKRLADTTGRGVGQPYLDLLEPGKGTITMDSKAMSVPLAALRALAPGREREQLEALQKAFYVDGLDVLDPYVQATACSVDEESLILVSSQADIQEQAERDREEALDVLGDFVIYPTLFLEKDNGKGGTERHLLARGYTAPETVRTRLEEALADKTDQADLAGSKKEQEAGQTGHACGPDGCCIL